MLPKDTCVPRFKAALSTIARTWKQRRCPSTDECIKRMSHTHTPHRHSGILLSHKKEQSGSFLEIWVMCASLLSLVQLFAISWTVACQTPLSMEFSRQEYWSGLPCPLPGDPLQGIFPTQGSNPNLPHCRQILSHLSHQGSPEIWMDLEFSLSLHHQNWITCLL